MELKKYKRINNTKRLPGFNVGFNGTYTPQLTNPLMGSQYYGIPNYKMQLNFTFNSPLSGNNTPSVSDIYGKNPLQMSGEEFFKMPANQPNNVTNLYWKGVGNNALSNAGNIAMSGMAAVGAIKNAGLYNKSVGDLLQEGGTSNAVINGIGYQVQEGPNIEREKAEVEAQNKANTVNAMSSGASAGSAVGSIFGPVGGAVGGIVGGIGGLIGGLFGSSKRKREMRRRIRAANEQALLNNREAANEANSKGMQLDYLQEYGDTRDDVLYAYDKGKDKTVTPYGKTNEEPNSRVSVGEPVLDGLDDVSNAAGYIPKTGKPHADDQLASLSESSVVLGSDKDWRNGLTFMEQGQPYTNALEKINKKYENRTNKSIEKLRGNIGKKTDELQQANINIIKEPIVEKLNDLADQLKYQHETLNNIDMRQYKRGKDKYARYDIGKEGWVNNFVPNAIGAGLSMKLYFDAKDQPLHTPNIYAENPYELRGLNTLAGVKMNGYPILQQLRDAETRSNYAIDNSGGLTGAQKYLGRIANANNMYLNVSNMWQDLQKQNNAYKSQYAQAALSTGAANASRRQAANEYRENMYAKAHGARMQQMLMGMRNFMDYLNQYSANEFKRRQFNDMLGLYQADMGIKPGDKSGKKGSNLFQKLFGKKGSKTGEKDGGVSNVMMDMKHIPSLYYAKTNAPQETLKKGIPSNFMRTSDAMPTTLSPDMSTNNHSRINMPKLTYFRNSRYAGTTDTMPGRTDRDMSGFDTNQPAMPQRSVYMDINGINPVSIQPSNTSLQPQAFQSINPMINMNMGDLSDYAYRMNPQQYSLTPTRRKRKGGLDYQSFMNLYGSLNSGRMNVIPN